MNIPIYQGYTVCPVCGRLTPTDTGYCRHCRAPLPPGLGGSSEEAESDDFDLELGSDPSTGRRVGVRKRDLRHHLVISGIVGMGKTLMSKRMLAQLSYGSTGYLVTDVEGEYADLELYGARILGGPGSRDPLRINLFSPSRRSIREVYADAVYSIMYEVVAEEIGGILTPQMEAVLRETIYLSIEEGVGIKEFPRMLERVSRRYPQGNMTYTALSNRLHWMMRGPLSKILVDDDDSLEDMEPSSRLVLDYSWMSRFSRRLLRVLVKLTLIKLHYRMMEWSMTQDTRMLIVVEESELVFSPEAIREGFLGIAVHMMMRLRKRGVGVAVITHGPSMIHGSIVKSAGNMFMFRHASYEEAKIAAGLLGSPSLASTIQALKERECIALRVNGRSPTLMRIEPPPPPDLHLHALVRHVQDRPLLSQRERRNSLGYDGSTYRRVVNEAVDRGLLEVVEVYTGRGRPVKLLQRPRQNPGVDHMYAEARAAEIVEEVLGAKPRRTCRGPDISFRLRGERICIEIDTGSNISAAKYERFLEKCSHLIIIPTSRRTYRRIARTVEKRGLAGRVSIAYLSQLPRLLRSLRGPSK